MREARFSELNKRMVSKKLSLKKEDNKQSPKKQKKVKRKELNENIYRMLQYPEEEKLNKPKEWN